MKADTEASVAVSRRNNLVMMEIVVVYGCVSFPLGLTVEKLGGGSFCWFLVVVNSSWFVGVDSFSKKMKKKKLVGSIRWREKKEGRKCDGEKRRPNMEKGKSLEARKGMPYAA